MSSRQGPPQPPPVPDGDSAGTPMAAAAPPPLGSTPWISFAGAPNETAAAFIQAVQRIAFTQNRVKDDEWIAEYASACFSDSALMWYLTLDEETQTNWKKLRLALAQRYPVQAAPQPAAPLTTAPAKPKSASPASTEIGRIEVVRPEYGDFFGYLSQDSTGNFVVAAGPEKALKLKAVLHTNSKNQHEKIYSLRVLDARDSRYPFLGLRLVKFLREDPDVVPEMNPRDLSKDWQYWVNQIPTCCKPVDRLSGKVGYPWNDHAKSTYPTWDFTQATESKPGPYYMRKAEGPDPKTRVVSAVWSLVNPSKDVTELRLTWPRGDSRQGNVISEMAVDAVLHNGGTEGLHAHLFDFTRTVARYSLQESHVVLLFKPIPNA